MSDKILRWLETTNKAYVTVTSGSKIMTLSKTIV